MKLITDIKELKSMDDNQLFNYINSIYDKGYTMNDLAISLNIKYNTLYVFLKRKSHGRSSESLTGIPMPSGFFEIPVGQDKYVAARISLDDYDKYRYICAKLNITMSAELQKYIKNFINKHMCIINDEKWNLQYKIKD